MPWPNAPPTQRNNRVTFFPPLRIGMLGGGQLGRMMALASARLGLTMHIYCPDPESPAFEVAGTHTVAAYDDEAALAQFAASVDVVTYEFENVPAKTADFLAARVPVRPGTRALAVSQDRLTEKTYLNELGIETAPFVRVDTLADLEEGLRRFSCPALLKTRSFGYDGKGQVRITAPDQAAEAFAAMKGQPAILEGFVPFEREVSVLVARGLDGSTAVYDIAENEHRDQILRLSHIPARVQPTTETAAADLARKLADGLGYVGVLAVELFVVMENGRERLIANEIAPRVHNSGHWTEAGCLVSQFEMHVRAIAGLPLGSARRHSDVVMENLIGDDVDRVPQLLNEPDAMVHLYGKREARPGRKMGHVNWLKR
jgi:5-(carboxyamino)imidazole ribonucleotide synthase